MFNKVFLLIRIAVGALLMISGAEKLTGHYQNFLYVVQQYEVLPLPLESVVAYAIPWVELFLGIFLVLGLYLRYVLLASSVLFIGFILIIVQALIRQLPITECGCLGELISFPLHVTLLMDITIVVLLVLSWRNRTFSSFLSLDNYFQGK